MRGAAYKRAAGVLRRRRSFLLQLRSDQHVDRARVEQREETHACDPGDHEPYHQEAATWGQS